MSVRPSSPPASLLVRPAPPSPVREAIEHDPDATYAAVRFSWSRPSCRVAGRPVSGPTTTTPRWRPCHPDRIGPRKP